MQTEKRYKIYSHLRRLHDMLIHIDSLRKNNNYARERQTEIYIYTVIKYNI